MAAPRGLWKTTAGGGLGMGRYPSRPPAAAAGGWAVPARGRPPHPTCAAGKGSAALGGAALTSTDPHDALAEGRWFKLICGASLEDLPAVRSLALAYALAGADCVDCACDPAVVAAVESGLEAAGALGARRPWLMVSVNDDEDPHFRKATFDARRCPADCPRPCELVCPAAAIPPGAGSLAAGEGGEEGVIQDKCYGCGRCVPICPLGIIGTESYTRDPADIAALLRDPRVDAVEIHTRGRPGAFAALWATEVGAAAARLPLVAVSCPDLGDQMVPTLQGMSGVMGGAAGRRGGELIWQLDGRAMSGDIGAGATRACVALAGKVAADPGCPPGHLQLAGGTNPHTIEAVLSAGLREGRHVAGAAYGGSARKALMPILAELDSQGPGTRLEDAPDLLAEAVSIASGLVHPWKDLPPAAGPGNAAALN